MAEKQLQILRICALLHDIGKIRSWADKHPFSDHVKKTYEFVKSTLGEEYAQTAMRHHKGKMFPAESHPASDIEKIICLASNFASGADVMEDSEHDDPCPEMPIVLKHVLSKGKAVDERSSFDEARLAAVSNFLGQKIKEIGDSMDEKPLEVYLKIFDLLEGSELRKIPADPRGLVDDVSLWTHLRLTAAFATCIWMDGGYRGDAYDKYEFAVLSGDADWVSSYINVSRRLPDLYSRSERIKKATDNAVGLLTKMLGPECVVFAAGGSFVALSPAGKAEDVLRMVREKFAASTEGKTTITVCSVVANGKEFMEDFKKVWEQARSELGVKKSQREVRFMDSVEEGVDVCDVCHVKPCSVEDINRMLRLDAAPRPERLCSSCWQLRKEGRPIELNALKDKANLVALLRADGDDMGKVMRGDQFEIGKAITASRLSTLSDLINLTCESKLKALIQDYGGETVFAGGDDILAFVPGEKGLRAAEALASCFRDEMAGKCSMSVGIAIFRYDLPVYFGLDVANRLLRKAKEENKNKVAYSIISGSGMTSNELEKVRPMEWKQLNELLNVVESMDKGGVTSSQLRNIASVATQSVQKAEILVKYLVGRSIISWGDGKKFLSYLESGALTEAFFIYNLYKSDET